MTETWSWIDAGGVSSSMNNWTEGLEVLEGVQGRYMPPIRRTRDVVAGIAGSRLRVVQHDLRAVDVPILLKASTEEARALLIQEWAAKFDPARGTGILDVVNANGDRRQLACVYASGLEGAEDSNRTPGAQAAVLTFEADDPYWYDLDPHATTFSTTTSIPLWFKSGAGILPITLGSTTVVGGSDLMVGSDVDVWPTWTITGPGSALVVRNNTTGREFAWGGTLTGGQVLTIDTRPGIKSVLREDLSNQFASLTEWDLWPLIPGDNNIDVTLTGTTSASAITLAWINAHLTP